MAKKTKQAKRTKKTKKAKQAQDDVAADKAYCKIQSRVTQRIHEVVGEDSELIYSAYANRKDIPVDNLDKVAIKGQAVIVAVADPQYPWTGKDSKNFISEILHNPTWLDLCVVAHQQMRATKDQHHCFLEGVTKLGKYYGDFYALDMGS